MEKEPLVVKIPEKPKSAHFYYLKELSDDINVFSQEEQQLVKKIVSGDKLTGNELRVFNTARDKWWSDKYGFPFTNKTARNEVLDRKYNPENSKEAHALQWSLLQAVQESDQETIAGLKNKYQEEYPDQMEAIEVLFGIRDFLNKSLELNKDRKVLSGQDKKDKYKDLTEYQFLFTHFLIQNNKNRDFLKLFWDVASTIAEKTNATKELNMLRRGQMSQVAVYRIIQELGQDPKLSHPDEDAFEAIDLWENTDKAVQIKGWDEEVPAVFNTDEVVFPAMQVDVAEKKGKLYNSVEYFKSKNNVFRAKIKRYGKRLGKKFEGHMLVVPYSKIDFINGEPAPELIEFFKDKLAN